MRRANRDDIVTTIEAAVEQAKLAYEFTPGSYTASALSACLHAREAALAMPTIDDQTEREAGRKARNRQAMRDKRRKQGMKPRADALGHGKPWETEGVSRATMVPASIQTPVRQARQETTDRRAAAPRITEGE